MTVRSIRDGLLQRPPAHAIIVYAAVYPFADGTNTTLGMTAVLTGTFWESSVNGQMVVYSPLCPGYGRGWKGIKNVPKENKQ